jgi:2-oxoglutarate ferredoxin oxidoreductase subunit gamma
MSASAEKRDRRLIVAGFGGQGVLTLGKLLCMAAMDSGQSVTYLPSYGAEVRGGTCNCRVVLSDGEIYSPLVPEADALIVLNEPSYARFASTIKPDGVMLLNTSAGPMGRGERPPCRAAVEVRATELAAELGDVRVANTIMLGALVETTGWVTPQACLGAMENLLGERKAHMLDMNTEAFECGRKQAAAAMGSNQ